MARADSVIEADRRRRELRAATPQRARVKPNQLDRFRRKAAIAGRENGRRNWAESAPTGSPREGLESVAEPPFHCEREIGVTTLKRH